MEFVYFMFFSTIEAMSLTAILLSLFRFKITDFIWQSLLVCLVLNGLSFILREELNLESLSPVVNLLLLVCFVVIFVQVPLLWSFVMCITGFTVFVVISTIVIILLFGVESLSTITEDPAKSYISQAVTGAVTFAIAYVLYRFGWGLAYSFEKVRFKWEKYFMMVLIAIMTATFGLLLYYKVVYLVIMITFFGFLFFFTYTMQKEVASHNSKSVK